MTEKKINFKLDPEKTPVLSVDGYMISSNENFVVLNFAQAIMGNGDHQHVVSRVAMSPRQVKEFLEKLNDHIQKFEV